MLNFETVILLLKNFYSEKIKLPKISRDWEITPSSFIQSESNESSAKIVLRLFSKVINFTILKCLSVRTKKKWLLLKSKMKGHHLSFPPGHITKEFFKISLSHIEKENHYNKCSVSHICFSIVCHSTAVLANLINSFSKPFHAFVTEIYFQINHHLSSSNGLFQFPETWTF